MTFEIFFLSYTESNAESNWLRLRTRFPQAKRLHGIQGVLKAHSLIATCSSTDFYFIVDGDNQIHDDFDFAVPFAPQKDSLYVWRARNPVNQLVYGFGGIKLYNRSLFHNAKVTGPDVATTIAPKYIPVMTLASTTYFNASPLESWRGAFRESAKLTMNINKNPTDRHSCERLSVWLSKGEDQPQGKWCILGAQQGRAFALNAVAQGTGLQSINDFQWLNNEFLKTSQKIMPDSLSDLTI
jgi:hypothetical protein